ncbi:MAG: DUF3147 family protein [Hyphomicrobiaceae bacterium]
MLDTFVKALITTVLVIAITEAAKRSTLFGALVASLPLTSLIAIVWLWGDTGDARRIADLSSQIFWLVLPSLVLFVALPLLLRAGVQFWPSMAIASGLTVAAYLGMVALLTRSG